MRPALLLLLALPALAGEDELFDRLRSPDGATRAFALEQVKALESGSRLVVLRRIVDELDDPYVLSTAAFEIGQLGPAAAPAVDDLIRLCYAPDLRVRLGAVQALGGMGPTAWKVCGILAELRDEAPIFVWSVDSALRSIGAPDREEPDPLADAPWRKAAPSLDHTHPYVRHHACRALARGGTQGIAILARAVHHPTASVRLRAVRALADARDPAALAALLEVLRTGEGRIVEIAIEGLGLLGSAEAEAGILEALRDADLPRARTAVTALERIRPGATEPVLRAWLDAPDPKRGELAVQLISERSETADRFLPDLIQWLYTSRRDTVLRVLALLGPRAAAAGPFLLDLQRGEADHYLAQVVRATGAKEPLADPFDETTGEAELLAALRGDDWLRAGLGARRLGAVGDPAVALDALAIGLRHPKPFVAASCLDALEARGASALPALTEALDEGSLETRRRALKALTALGPGSAPAADAVIRALDEIELQAAAMQWVTTVGRPAAAAAPKLIRWYREGHDRAGIGLVLASLGEAGAGIVPDLIRDVSDETLGFHPILALRNFGPLAGSAAPRLARLVRERHEGVPNARQHHVVVEALATLPYLGEPGEAETRALLESDDLALARLATDALFRRQVDAELQLRIYWGLRDSESAFARDYARRYLRIPDVMKRLDRSQLVELSEAEPGASKELAAELMRRSEIPFVAESLSSEHLVVRGAAVDVLKARKEEATPAVPALARRLTDEPDPGVRRAILGVLCDVAGKGAQPHVVEYARKYMKRGVSDDVVLRMRGWGDVAFLAGMLTDDDKRIRALASRVLVELKPEPDEALRQALVGNLLDPERRTFCSAIILTSWGAEQGAPVFVELLRSLKREEYGIATSHLEKMGADALPALRAALADKHPTVRARTVYLVEKCGPAADDDLVRVLAGDASPEVREAVVRALAHRGTKAAPAILPALEDGDRAVRNRAWSFFEDKREAQPLAVPVLVRALTKGELESETIERLRSIRDVALPVLQAEAKLDASPALVLALAELGEIDERTLRPFLTGDDERARLRAVRLIAQLGPGAEASVRDLLVLLATPDPKLLEEVVRTLGCLRSAARPAVDRLLSLRSDGNSSLRDALAVAVTRIEHPPLVLVDLMLADGSRLDREVWRVLRQARVAALPELMALTECDHEGIARSALEMIGALGPSARAAIPLLKRLAKNQRLARYANVALAKIQPK